MSSGLVTVAPYDPEWPSRFEADRALLERVLAPWLSGGVHHIGSTAIPGMAAKPIIDMIAGVRELEEARAAFGRLAELGYVHAPHRAHEAHHFEKPAPGEAQVSHGVHLTEPETALWRERLAFRDVLRTDSTLAEKYEALKRRLAQLHADDITAYTAGSARSSRAPSRAP